MLRSLLLVSLLIVASEARRCYSCTSAADCLSVGVGRIQECDSRMQCYTVQINGRPQLKGCTASCAAVDRHSELHLCHTCEGDLCNGDRSTTFQVNNQGHHGSHHRHNRREARRHNDNSNIGSGVNVGGGAGIGGGVSPNNNNYGSSNSNYGSGIGNGASIGGSGGIGNGASVGGSGIGGGAAPHGSNKRHHKRNIGHGVSLDSSIGGGAAPVGGGAYPANNWHSPAGIGGGVVPDSYPSQHNGNQRNEQAGYNGIGGGARPVGGSSSSLFSIVALAAPLALLAHRV